MHISEEKKCFLLTKCLITKKKKAVFCIESMVGNKPCHILFVKETVKIRFHIVLRYKLITPLPRRLQIRDDRCSFDILCLFF